MCLVASVLLNAENSVVTAIIGATGTVVGALIPTAYNIIKDRKNTPLSGRRDTLRGRWEGNGKDYYVEGSDILLSFELVMTFTATARTVEADAELSGTWNSIAGTDELAARGAFYNDDLLQLSYWNKKMGKKQLGMILLGLSPDGETLRGSYTGFSPRRNAIVAGTVELKKKS